MVNSMRLLAVGDIHGCLCKLEALVTKIRPSQDEMVFLGDYINRGPDSRGVVDFLLDLRSKVPCVFLLGNHEKMILEFFDNNNSEFLLNGGDKTLESYNCNNFSGMPFSHISFFNGLYPYYETNDHIFVHAGLKPGIPTEEQKVNDLIWIRDEFLCSDYDWGKTIVYGHTINRMPILLKNRIGLDTGCVYPSSEGYGCLTGCDVMERVIYSV
jgi:serine/threonine protein phosphatase 1